jgi:hypothetical protein
MSDIQPPANGSTIFQIVVDGQKTDIVADFDTAIQQIGYTLAGSVQVMNEWKKFPEFERQTTEELAGTFYHRIRYAMIEQKREYSVEEHSLNGLFGAKSFVRSIDMKNELDPAFEIQAGLNFVARGIESVPTASGKVEALIASHIKVARMTKSDAEIIEGLKEVHQRMGGEDFVGEYKVHGTEFLDHLPGVARARFDELAAEMTNTVGLRM